MECTTSEGRREAVISGNGYSFISSLAVDRDVKLGKIKVCDTGSFKIKRPFFIFTSKVRPLNDSAANFIEFIRSGMHRQKK
jgi:DNA-binding transcriptional LysR family regulator